MRKNADWIQAFVDHTTGIKSPELFRRWAAVSAVSAAIQRCAFTRLSKQKLFPNLYVLLIAYPGIGKSNAIKMAREVVRRISDIRLTPTRITQRAFYNELAASKSDPVNMPDLDGVYTHSSLTAMIEELSVFVRPRNNEFMADLADVYDCPDPFEHKTATQGEVFAENSWFNLIGGATPTYIRDSWTSTVLDEGFPARCIIVYSDETVDVPLFDEDESLAISVQEATNAGLVDDLREIGKLRGRILWERDASEAFQLWFKDGMNPRPDDPRLLHYCQRRHIHIAKLCMIYSVARRGDGMISMEDFISAKEMLLCTETSMNPAVETMGASPFKDAMGLVTKFIEKRFKSTGMAVQENAVRQILLNEIDPMRINAILGEMIGAGMLRVTGEESAPFRKFLPRE